MTLPLTDLNLALKVSTNVYWNRAETDHCKSIIVLNEKVSVTSNSTGFRIINNSVATSEQVKKVCPTFTQNEESRMMEFKIDRLIFKIFFPFSFHKVVYLSHFIHSTKRFQL